MSRYVRRDEGDGTLGRHDDAAASFLRRFALLVTFIPSPRLSICDIDALATHAVAGAGPRGSGVLKDY